MLGLGGEDPGQLGSYRLRAVIGDGGMGRVYLGTSLAGRAVAVKVISPGLANQPGYRQRFAREARAAMAVSGIYTASVVDADTTSERPYIATEFVAAPSLADSVRATGPLPAASVFALAGGLAEALAAIHRAGLVHRDVKPSNILLAADGPVVIDFGIARGDEASLTATGTMIGTPGYIAPEVLRGHDPAAASDIFSLACVLVYAARGTGPYGMGDPLSMAHRTVSQPPDLTGTPEPVRALVKPLLEQDPTLRPTPAQLLQQVSLTSGTTVLHDAMWLPDGIRALLEQRRTEVQRVLSDHGGQVPDAPAMTPTYTAPAPAPDQATRSYAYPVSQPPMQPPYPPLAAPADPNRRRNRMFATVGGSVIALVAIVTAVVLAGNNSSPGGQGLSSSSNSAKPGTYAVNRLIATDSLGDTATLQTIVVNNDGTVDAQFAITAASYSYWTCAYSVAGEAGLNTANGTTDPSTGSSCTSNPSRVWVMTAGQTTPQTEYFAHAPTGGGPWTLTVATRSFHGTVSGINIPTN